MELNDGSFYSGLSYFTGECWTFKLSKWIKYDTFVREKIPVLTRDLGVTKLDGVKYVTSWDSLFEHYYDPVHNLEWDD
jgi:hypothetical protein